MACSGSIRRGPTPPKKKNLARLIDYFGKTRALTDIDHNGANKMVAWRRGHRVSRRGKLTKEKGGLPLISKATVNRSTTKVLQRLFTFARPKAPGSSANRDGPSCCCPSRWSGCASTGQ